MQIIKYPTEQAVSDAITHREPMLVLISFDGEILEGTLPKKQVRLIQAWGELHQDELKANWTLIEQGEQMFKIEPLK